MDGRKRACSKEVDGDFGGKGEDGKLGNSTDQQLDLGTWFDDIMMVRSLCGYCKVLMLALADALL